MVIDVFKSIRLLSGGEKARLSLLKIMLSPHNLLLLDEPTNHLDIPARENLEASLQEYDGTIFFISHDRYFINSIANKVLELSSEGTTTYLGNYSDYQAKKKQLELDKEPESEAPITKTQFKQDRKKEREQRLQEKAQRKAIEEMELELEKTEALMQEAEEKMCLPEVFQDPAKSKKLHLETLALKNRLESLYEKWEKMMKDADY